MAEVLLKRLNTRGIPAIQSIAVNTVGNVLTVTFNNHPYVQDRFAEFWLNRTNGCFRYRCCQFTTSGVLILCPIDGTQATAANQLVMEKSSPMLLRLDITTALNCLIFSALRQGVPLYTREGNVPASQIGQCLILVINFSTY